MEISCFMPERLRVQPYALYFARRCYNYALQFARGESMNIYLDFMRLALHESKAGYLRIVIISLIHSAATAIHHSGFMDATLNWMHLFRCIERDNL